MHSDVNHSSPHADLLREKMQQKIMSAIKVANSQEQVIDYCDIIYLINEKNIKKNVIKTFLHEIYADKLEEINQNWQKELSSEQILSDIFKIKKKAVEEQWTELNIDERQVKMKEQKYKDYEQRSKTRKQLNYRIKQLNDELKIVENNINICKNESQQLKLRQKYQQMKEQYRFLTNKSRKLRHLSQQKMINCSLSKSQEKLHQIQERIDEIAKQELRIKQIESLQLNKQTDIQIQMSPRKQQSRLKKLQDIFIKFAKKQVHENMLFDQKRKNQRLMSLQNYLKMLTRTGVGNMVTLDEKVNIFKKTSAFSAKINFHEFQQVLKLICVQQCDKLKINFNSTVFDAFLNDSISRLQLSSSHKLPALPILSNSNDFMKDLRSQVFSNYQFKIRGHTGKQKQQIEQLLKQKKISNKTQPCSSSSSVLTNLALEKLTNSSKISNQSDRVFKQGKKFTKRKYANTNSNLNHYKTVNVSNQQLISESRSFKTSFQNDSYSNIFLKKRSILAKDKLRSQKIQSSKSYLLEDQDLSTSVIKGDFINKLTPIRYLIGQNEGDTEELRDIVQIDEEDPFLTSHFAHKYSLNSSKTPSLDSKYHF